MLTAYDYPTARLVDSVGVEGILVGDSLGMVVQGRASTLPVTLDEMIYHAQMVGRAARHALVVVDMPFPTSHLGTHQVIADAARLLKETPCQAVKLESGVDQAEVIVALVSAGIPVMGHCGLRPQGVLQMGGFRVQRDEEQVWADAKALEQAGAFAVVLECIPAGIAEQVTTELSVPTIGIGAGPSCDGQILVLHDMLGLGGEAPPRHAKAYADLNHSILRAVTQYRDEVREGTFPGKDQTFR